MSTDDIAMSKQQPAAYQALVALNGTVEQAAADAGLTPLLVELVKIRVSQLNGCAFCLRMHCRDARSRGETDDRLAVVAAWWESQYFDAAEQEALALAEQVTLVAAHATAPHRAADAVDPVAAVPATGALDEAQRAAVAWLATVMNAWNRVAVTSHYPVGP